MVGPWVLESDGQRTVPTLLLTGFVTPRNKVHLCILVITLPVTLYFTLLDYRRIHRHASKEFLTLQEALSIHLVFVSYYFLQKK